MLAKDLLRRPWLAGNLRESQEKRLCQPSGAHTVDADRLFFRGPLQNHRVQVLDPPREFRPPAQKLIELFYFFVQGDRKSTRLNSSHGYISYAVFCLKKKKKIKKNRLS